jgi:hypothetical protein
MHRTIVGLLLIASTAVALAQPASNPADRIAELPCDQVSNNGLQMVLGNSPAPFGIPLFQWSPDVWAKFEERAKDCIQRHQNGALSDSNPMTVHRLIVALQSVRRYAIETAIRKENVRAAEAIGAEREKAQLEAEAVKRRATKKAEADRLLTVAQANNPTAAELETRIKSYSASLDDDVLSGSDGDRYKLALNNLQTTLETVRRTEADAWERERPQREAKAAAQAVEMERLERMNKEMRETEEAERARSAKIEELKSAAAEVERSRLARLEYEKQAPAREAAAAKAEAAKLAAAQAEQEEQRKPLSCGNLENRVRSFGKTLESSQKELVDAALMGDKKSICKIGGSMVDLVEPLHNMAIECKNVGAGFATNNLLSSFHDALHDEGC